MPLITFNNMNIDAEAARIKEGLMAAVDDDGADLMSFLDTFRQPQSSISASSEVIQKYLSRHAIRTVAIPQPNGGGGPPSISSLMNYSEGMCLVMNGLLPISLSVPPSPPRSRTSSPDRSPAYRLSKLSSDLATKTSTAAMVAAYAFLHSRQEHIRGTITLLVLSDDESGSRESLEYLLHRDERRELFRGDCVLSSSSQFATNPVEAEPAPECSDANDPAKAIAWGAPHAAGEWIKFPRAVERSYRDAWTDMEVPVYSCVARHMDGHAAAAAAAAAGVDDGAETQAFIDLVKNLVSTALDFMNEGEAHG